MVNYIIIHKKGKAEELQKVIFKLKQILLLL